jgi:hypothetical protein
MVLAGEGNNVVALAGCGATLQIERLAGLERHTSHALFMHRGMAGPTCREVAGATSQVLLRIQNAAPAVVVVIAAVLDRVQGDIAAFGGDRQGVAGAYLAAFQGDALVSRQGQRAADLEVAGFVLHFMPGRAIAALDVVFVFVRRQRHLPARRQQHVARRLHLRGRQPGVADAGEIQPAARVNAGPSDSCWR